MGIIILVHWINERKHNYKNLKQIYNKDKIKKGEIRANNINVVGNREM